MLEQIPLIDLKKLWDSNLSHNQAQAGFQEVADSIDKACRQIGFFVVQNHNIPESLFHKVHELALQFFSLPQQEKSKIRMAQAGKAWRGWFPLGGQLTSGKADGKQGIYFGTQDQKNDPRPLHGSNLFPDSSIPEFRQTILNYIQSLKQLGHTLMKCIAIALKMHPNYFEDHITRDPTILFRIFHYPPNPSYEFGVGEHTDYGLITLLCIDDCGGLQVKSPKGQWISAPCPDKGRYLMIINIGDMLQKLSEGQYRSTPHRVKNNYSRQRISFPLFFDPSWSAKVKKLPLGVSSEGSDRWDGADLSAWQGQYGQYLTEKVSKCFPELFGDVISK